ncbi:MAG: ABC transporter permease [Oscillospiraceae bacterium]|nr:ABC transporter permease [Oscillospiraceae bacterium]
MRMQTFSMRNLKEIARDPVSVAFGLGFPVALLLLLTAIQANIPVPLFELSRLAPGISVFGLAFLSLFSATVIARDRSSAFLQRLYTTPLTPSDFILGYTLPLVPLAMAQSAVCYAAAILLGLQPSVYILLSILATAPISVLYIALGLLCGSVLNDKQVGGICGALLTNLSAWLSGVWFDLALVGGVFQKIADLLPFVHCVQLQQAVLTGDFAGVFPHLWWVLGYGAALLGIAVLLFLKQMKRQ